MKILLLAVSLALAVTARARVEIVDVGAGGGQINLSATYSQNFDSLSSTASNAPWLNDSTVPGWHANRATYSANGGSLSSYGSGIEGERALGATSASFAVVFENQSSSVIGSIDISYRGEQWTRGAGNIPQRPDVLIFEYQIFNAGTGSVGVGLWQEFASLSFTAPNATESTGAVLNGNAVDNYVDIEATLTGFTLSPGEEIWLRWSNVNDTSFSDYAMGIDDLTISFGVIPEPASSAALLGFAALGLAAWRRPRKV